MLKNKSYKIYLGVQKDVKLIHGFNTVFKFSEMLLSRDI